ncbi:MAG: T9SS type A sorting domain-containing protein [Candidatus Onthomorpha sp.]|nr:T9SS type A sorting domain-containing protein [Candidatus Onthomorpha sp.]
MNPISGFATVEFETLQEHSLLRIADFGGRIVKTFDLSAGTENVRLDLRDLPSGVYTLMIGNTTKKLIVE